MRKKLMILTALCLVQVGTAARPAADPGASPTSVVVEASGMVPGFTPKNLVTYLADRMQKTAPAPWHFIAAQPGAGQARNRVVWAFKAVRMVWPGSNFKDLPPAIHSAIYLRVRWESRTK